MSAIFILAIFTLMGFNFTFWSVMSFFRFLSEEEIILINPQKKDEVDLLGLCIALLTSICSFFIFPILFFFSSRTVAIDVVFFSKIFIDVILLWFFCALLGGYIIRRIRNSLGIEGSLALGALYFLFFMLLLIFLLPHIAIYIISNLPLLTLGFFLSVDFFLVGEYFAKKFSFYELHKQVKNRKNLVNMILPKDVAVLIPAHNEEGNIRQTIEALKDIVPKDNIYVGSDASTDSTVAIVKSSGCTVDDIRPNRGKAKVLTYLLEKHDIYERFKAVMIVDADTLVDKDYMKYALPLFNNPQVAAVAGHCVTSWYHHKFPTWRMVFSAYRIRLWRILQYATRYGQAWKYTNMTSIIPGGSSVYRTSVIKQLEVDAPGLIIEDFNMTFEVHYKKLGKIAFNPKAFVINDEPYSMRDYVKQIRRWYLGFWQTYKRHGFRLNLFWFSISVYILELVLYSLFMLLVPATIAIFFYTGFQPFELSIFGIPYITKTISFFDVLLGVFITDYLLTLIVAAIEKKGVLMLYGFLFLPIRLVEGFMYLFTILLAFIVKSDGRWASPKRGRASLSLQN